MNRSHTLIEIDETEYEKYVYLPSVPKRFIYYKCINCNSVFERYKPNQPNDIFGINKFQKHEDMDCDEIIIKNIIE